MSIVFACIAVCVALFPIYLWGYGASCLLDTPWNRRRFWLGMIIGWVSVGMVYLFSILSKVGYLYAIWAGIIFVFVIGLLVYFLVYRWSVVARGLLGRVTQANVVSISVIVLSSLLVTVYIPGSSFLLVTIFPLLLSSLIEESIKHLTSIGLMSQDFRFSRSDVIIFTLFVVLGFIFVENILYLYQYHSSISTWIFRSFFSLSAHLLAATICAYAWWRSLSYEPFSISYIAIFSLGFMSAVLAHLGYNLILEQGSIVGLLCYIIIGYVVITRAILDK
jgi:hypothetical protein